MYSANAPGRFTPTPWPFAALYSTENDPWRMTACRSKAEQHTYKLRTATNDKDQVIMLALPCIEYRMACGGEWHFTGMVGAPVPPKISSFVAQSVSIYFSGFLRRHLRGDGLDRAAFGSSVLMVFLESFYVHVLAQHFKVTNFVRPFDFF